MTVSQIREAMQERVIPESVLPQNIAACLIDENAVPPELDAFTFLNRLRSLGIGSADFLYLLEGSGAPAQAVEKIKQHPDMNLQSLIVTLDSSGLTAKDYTRMLYTARQLWENTITMRIDLDEAPEGRQEAEPSEPVLTARQRKSGEFREYAGVKPIGNRNTAEVPPEDIQEAAEEKPERPVRTARQRKRTDDEFHEYVGVKPIGRRNEPDIQEQPEPERFTAVQKKPSAEPEPENTTDEEADSTSENGVYAGSRGGIIASAVGAVILCAVCEGVQLMGFNAPDSGSAKVHFAESNEEIFSEIVSAYNAGNIGGGSIQPIAPGARVFGELLIDSGEQLGVYSSGSTAWAAVPEQITVYSLDGSAQVTSVVTPPSGSEFVSISQNESGITAVFSGKNVCGAAGIDESGEKWLMQQCGTLTDICFADGSVSLGSVYVPQFTESFTADDEVHYLPWTAHGGETSVLPFEDIAIGGTQGCSYAVWGEYSMSDGGMTDHAAALGDPLFSAAERFSAVMNTENGSLLLTDGGENGILTCELSETTACAYSDGITAAAELTDGSTTVYLRGADLQPLGAFMTDGDIKTLHIEDGILYCGDGEKTTMAVDISSPDVPSALTLSAAYGRISGEYAVCCSTNKNGISITLFRLEDGTAVQADSFAKTLTAAELSTFSFGGANTIVIDGADRCGAAYRWFDGVSVVDEFAELGKTRSTKTLYDDRTGFTAAVVSDDNIRLIK